MLSLGTTLHNLRQLAQATGAGCGGLPLTEINDASRQFEQNSAGAIYQRTVKPFAPGVISDTNQVSARTREASAEC